MYGRAGRLTAENGGFWPGQNGAETQWERPGGAAGPIGEVQPPGLDEGLLSLSLSILLYTVNPYSYEKCR